MDFGLTPAMLRAGLILYILLIGSLCLRAYAQAWFATKSGDSTPETEGRLTLNPLVHMDLIGSVVLPLICIFYLQPRMGQIAFFLAWAKPVPLNPANFRNPGRDLLLTQLMNPAMSLLCALLAAIIGGALFRVDPRVAEVFSQVIIINACLIVIDMLPIPPLPGGTLLRHLGIISEEAYWNIARWSGLLLIIAFNIPPVRQLLGFLIAVVATPFLYLFDLLLQ